MTLAASSLMNAKEREEVCHRFMVTKMRFGLPLEEVRRVDRYLAAYWGIKMPSPPTRWRRRLRELGGSDLAAEYWGLHDVLASHDEIGAETPDVLVSAFYDLIADPRIHGHVHSQKRTEILDGGCVLLHLARTLMVTGAVLDIGCHTGHHAHLLAHETGLPVHGIDLCSQAIETAIAKTAGAANLTFSVTSFDDPTFVNAFDMVYAVRSITLDETTIGPVANTLRPGGVAVMMTTSAPDLSPKARKAIRDAGMAWGLSDIVGGWVGKQRVPEAGPVLVLIKGGTSPVPSDCMEQAMATFTEHFRDYANAPDTPDEEKTQAYCRAHWMKASESASGARATE
jgi:2-polyprenyl-3-methyl-5-hydroxy-6-metoxy-1,4-benzoquinol methylase